MIKSKETKNKGIEIDLTGPDGNAFAILGLAKRLCKEFDIPFIPLLVIMRSGVFEILI